MAGGTDLCISVVSHRHGLEVERLLGQLAAVDESRPRRVILTLNVPEPALAQAVFKRGWPFDLKLVENVTPKGYGANHNAAFALDMRLGSCKWYAVVNPDIQLINGTLAALWRVLVDCEPRTGMVYPVQVDLNGCLQDHERRLPTPVRLLRRYLPGASRREVVSTDEPDWVNAAFLVLRREAYAGINGFDDSYRMYCEDVDLCLRLRLAGWRLLRADAAVVVHGAHRASHRNLRHLWWHIQGLLRLWRSHAYAQYRLEERT